MTEPAGKVSALWAAKRNLSPGGCWEHWQGWGWHSYLSSCWSGCWWCCHSTFSQTWTLKFKQTLENIPSKVVFHFRLVLSYQRRLYFINGLISCRYPCITKCTLVRPFLDCRPETFSAMWLKFWILGEAWWGYSSWRLVHSLPKACFCIFALYTYIPLHWGTLWRGKPVMEDLAVGHILKHFKLNHAVKKIL